MNLEILKIGDGSQAFKDQQTITRNLITATKPLKTIIKEGLRKPPIKILGHSTPMKIRERKTIKTRVFTDN